MESDSTRDWEQDTAPIDRLNVANPELDTYDDLLVLEPNNSMLWYQRGLVLRRSGQIRAAIHSFDRALDLRPNFPEAAFSKLYTLVSQGYWVAYLKLAATQSSARTLQELQTLIIAFARYQLPTVIVVGLAAQFATQRASVGWSVAIMVLVIALIDATIKESHR